MKECKDRLQEVLKVLELKEKDDVNNSCAFRYFKLHSYSTLMCYSKKQLIEYIHMLYHNWQVTDGTCERLKWLLEEYVKDDN